jgi:hypothetical protein
LRPGPETAVGVSDVGSWRRAHFVGIGGAGMSGIARILLARGVTVTGSDLKDAGGVDALRRAGATVCVGHRADQVGHPDAVVVSSAIPPANVEVRQAARMGIPVVSRAQVLAALTRGTRTVAVAGTHGKTTTTSMVSVMLTRAGLDPTYVIGGDLNESGSGAGHGAGDIFVAEADESDGSWRKTIWTTTAGARMWRRRSGRSPAGPAGWWPAGMIRASGGRSRDPRWSAFGTGPVTNAISVSVRRTYPGTGPAAWWTYRERPWS